MRADQYETCFDPNPQNEYLRGPRPQTYSDGLERCLRSASPVNTCLVNAESESEVLVEDLSGYPTNQELGEMQRLVGRNPVLLRGRDREGLRVTVRIVLDVGK